MKLKIGKCADKILINDLIDLLKIAHERVIIDIEDINV